MTNLIGHPFLDHTIIHDLLPQIAEQETHEEKTKRRIKGPSNRHVVIATAVFATLFSTTIAASEYVSPLALNTKEAETPKVVNKNINSAPKNSYQIPKDYPGIYPGERIVFYYPAPLETDKIVQRIDTNGCSWNLVTNRGNGKVMYPLITENGLHACQEQEYGKDPLSARMIGDNFPRLENSSIKVVEVIDAASGDSMIARTSVNPLSREAVIAAREKRENIIDEAELAEIVKQVAAETNNKTKTPAKSTPVRVAASQPAKKKSSDPVSRQTVPTFDPRNPDVIRQIPQAQLRTRPPTQAQINVANNEPERLVPINPSARSRGEELVSISKPPTDLRGIRPLEPRQTTQPLRGGNIGNGQQERGITPGAAPQRPQQQ